MNDQDARRLFATAEVARLATVRRGGRPHLVPITLAVAGDLIFTAIDEKPKTTSQLTRLANIEADPRVSVLADHYDDDWERLWWVRADGAARVVHAGPDLERAIGLLADKYDQYRDRPPPGPAIVVEVERWTGWSAG